MRKQNFIQGTLFLIVILAIVKMFGMVNRFVIARLLTPDGFGVYMLVMPTFMLLISLSQLGFPISISKLVSENRVKKSLTNKSIILSAVKLSLINSVILITLLFFSAHFLATELLHDDRAYYPLLSLTIFIPLVAFSSILKGYLYGLEIIDIPAYSQLFEQILRIGASIGLVILFLPYGITFAVMGCIIAISIGEFVSILYMVVRTLNRKNIPYLLKPTSFTGQPTREILSISIPATGSRLIGSLTHFFEPIVFTAAMMALGIGSNYTTRLYGQISGYVISTLVVPSFVVVAISTTLLPVITKQYAAKRLDKIKEYFDLSLYLSYIVGAIYVIVIMLFPEKIMSLFFGTTEGVEFLWLMAPFFVFYFFEQPIAQMLHAINKTKTVMVTTLFCNTLKLFLIYVLTSQRHIHVYGLMIAIIVNILMISSINYLILRKSIQLKANYGTIILSILLFFATLFFGLFIKYALDLHFIFLIGMVFVFYLFILFVFNIGDIRGLKQKLSLSLQKSSQ